MSFKQQRSHLQFTSPLPRNAQGKEKTDEELKAHLTEINKEIDMLRAEGLKEDELKLHIEKLHEYNQLKDVGQAVLGQIATLRGVRSKDVYKDYGLDVND